MLTLHRQKVLSEKLSKRNRVRLEQDEAMSWLEELRREALSSCSEDDSVTDWIRFVLASSSPVRDVHVFATKHQGRNSPMFKNYS
jgi:hypothetical protein